LRRKKKKGREREIDYAKKKAKKKGEVPKGGGRKKGKIIIYRLKRKKCIAEGIRVSKKEKKKKIEGLIWRGESPISPQRKEM